jgi:hypothetical protein
MRLSRIEQAALRCLSVGPEPAGVVGAMVWQERRNGRTSAVQGGGDYAAQMLLGRLRKRGFVRVQNGEGSSVWEITDSGRTQLAWNEAFETEERGKLMERNKKTMRQTTSNAIAALTILLGVEAATSMRANETPEQWLETLQEMEKLLQRKIKIQQEGL